MTHKAQLISIISLLLFLSCSKKESQNKKYGELETEFNFSIKNSKAKSFEFQFDGLTPQKSYFVDCKLKFLTLRKSGELITTTELITFDKDSISKIIKRIEIYEGNDNGNTAGRDWNNIEADSIYIIDYVNRNVEVFAENKSVQKHSNLRGQTENDFIYRLKKHTEENYNCR